MFQIVRERFNEEEVEAPYATIRRDSLRCLRAAEWLGCESADGTFIKFGPDINLRRVGRWLEQLRVQPQMVGL